MFSKWFGKNPAPAAVKKFYPENRLEALLMRAAEDPGLRPEFFKELLEADLYVLIDPGNRPSGRFVAQPGDRLSVKGIIVEGRKLIPVFTTERRLREYIKSRDNLAKLNGRALLTMVAAQKDGVVLNPASAYGTEFTPQDVSSLVGGSIDGSRKHVIAKDTRVLIGAPAEYPEAAVKALTAYFQGKPEVKRAYVAQIQIPDSGEPPHLLFAVQVEGEFDPIASDLGGIFRETLGRDQFADLIQLGRGSLDDYFETQEPFFKR